MSRWEVGVKSGQNYTNVLEVSGVSHIDWDTQADVTFFSGKKNDDVPIDTDLKVDKYKTLLTVPYSELVYYKRLPKKGKKNG